MKSRTKLYSTFLLALTFLTSFALAEGPWLTDIPAAIKAAKDSDKPILVEFTGSDWCPPCKMMNQKVFSKEEFLKEASENYILVKIDIPQSDRELATRNEQVLAAYEVESVPTVLLLKPSGEEFHRFPATQNNTVPKFLAHIQDQKKRLSMQ